MSVSLNTPALNFVCGTTVYPSRFVVVSSAADYRVVPCSATTQEPVGITQEGSREPPVTGAGTEAGNVGDPIYVYGVQQTCILELATTVTRGQLVGPDTSGLGIPATTGNGYGAVALESGVAGDKIRVEVLIGQLN